MGRKGESIFKRSDGRFEGRNIRKVKQYMDMYMPELIMNVRKRKICS